MGFIKNYLKTWRSHPEQREGSRHPETWQRICLILAVLPPGGISGAPAMESLSLTPGDRHQITIPAEGDIRLSRKGIIDLQPLGDGKWQITAMRGGLAVVEIRSQLTGEIMPPRILVDVRSGENEDRPRIALGIPDWICRAEGISCSRQEGIVTGRAPAWTWHLRARETCRESRDCLYNAVLPEAERTKWLHVLRENLGPSWDVTMTANGLPIVRTWCPKPEDTRSRELVDTLTEGAVTRGHIAFACSSSGPDEAYVVALKYWMMSESAARELGFSAVANGNGSYPPLHWNHAVSTRLRALAAGHKALALADPVMRVLAGQSVQFASGGEFALKQEQSDGSSHTGWKSHGLSTSLTVWPEGSGKIRIALKSELRSRTRSGIPNLTLATVDTMTTVTAGVTHMLAVIDARGEEDTETSTPVLSSIPIIGPLFEGRGKEKESRKLVIWITLKPDDGRPDLQERVSASQ